MLCHAKYQIGEIYQLDSDFSAAVGGNVGPNLSGGADGLGRGLFIGTPRGHNWIFDRYSLSRRDDQPEGEPEWYAWRAPSWTNDVKFPGGKYDPEMVSVRDEAERGGLLPLYDQEYGADFTALQGRCYPKWDRLEHIVNQSAAMMGVSHVVGGADWGHRDPCALIVAGRTNDSQWRILAEWYARGKLHEEVMREMDRLTHQFHVTHWWCDSAEPARIAACIDRGMDARPAWKERNAGVMTVAPYMGRKGGFAVSRECRNLIREIESYCWDSSRIKEEPEKGEDHAVDAMRYCIATEEHVAGRQTRSTRIKGL
jgi:hypothetical protein